MHKSEEKKFYYRKLIGDKIMPATSGIVESITVKEMPSPDDYDNTHRGFIKLNGEDYGVGTFKNGKEGEIFTRAGLITVGAEIEFMYSVNGKYRNIKKSSINILKAGEPNTATPAAKASTKESAGTNSSYTVGVAVGAAINQACTLVAGQGLEPHLGEIEALAQDLYELAERLKSQAAAGDIRVTAEARAATSDALEFLTMEFAD